MEFTVEIHHETQSYWADVLELPGCLTEARTLRDLAVYLEDALQICLDDESVRLLTPVLAVGTVRITVSRDGAPGSPSSPA